MEELVAKRVAEELERRKDEIEAEVLRRVEEAKKVGIDGAMLRERESERWEGEEVRPFLQSLHHFIAQC